MKTDRAGIAGKLRQGISKAIEKFAAMLSFRFRPASVPASWVLFIFVVFLGTTGLWLGMHQDMSEHECLLVPGSGAAIDIPYTAEKRVINPRDVFGSVESNGMAYYIFMLGWINSGVRADWALRFPSLVAGLLSVLALYTYGKRLQGARLGLCSSFMLLVNALLIAATAHVRFYTFGMLFCLLFLNCLHKIWEQVNFERYSGKKECHLIVLATLCGVLAIASVVANALLVALVIALYLVASPRFCKMLGRISFISLCLALCCIFLHFHDPQALDRINYAQSDFWNSGGNCLFQLGYFRGHVPDPIHEQFIDASGGGTRLHYLMLALFFTLGWGVLAAFFRLWQTRRRKRKMVAGEPLSTALEQSLARVRLGIVVVPWISVALVMLFSMRVHFIWSALNLAFAIPLVSLSFGYGLAESPRIVRYAIILFMVSAAPLWGIATYIDGYGAGQAWRTLQAWRKPQDIVLVYDSVGNWRREPNPVLHALPKPTESALELVSYMTDISKVTPGKTTFVDERFLPKMVALAWKDSALDEHRVWVLEKASERMLFPRIDLVVPCYYESQGHRALWHPFGRERLWLINSGKQ